jgi:hypothetical protein
MLHKPMSNSPIPLTKKKRIANLDRNQGERFFHLPASVSELALIFEREDGCGNRTGVPHTGITFAVFLVLASRTDTRKSRRVSGCCRERTTSISAFDDLKTR